MAEERCRDSAWWDEFELWARRAYDDACAEHGYLDLDLESFVERLLAIGRKYLPANPPWPDLIAFVRQLHTSDLYLAAACGRHCDVAWRRFETLYRKTLRDIARFASPSSSLRQEIAADVLVDLFLPDRSGVSRIASFDGRSSLATWLRVVVSNRLINQHTGNRPVLARKDHSILPTARRSGRWKRRCEISVTSG